MMNTIEFQQRQRFTKNMNKYRVHEQKIPGVSTILNQYYAENKKCRKVIKNCKRMEQVEKNPLIRDVRNEDWGENEDDYEDDYEDELEWLDKFEPMDTPWSYDFV